MKKLSFKIALVMLLLFMTALVARADHPEGGPPEEWFDTIISPVHDFEVHYIDGCIDLGSLIPFFCLPQFYPSIKALYAAFALDNSRTRYDGNDDWSFPDGDKRDVWFYDCNASPDDFNCDNGSATTQAIFMPAPLYADKSESCTRMVLLHELFHHIEFAYTGGGCGWGICEGHARLMQDKLFIDLDDDPAASCVAPYLGSVEDYLDQPETPLWDFSYGSALWWNYLTEHYGEYLVEPYYGIDFIERWWETAQNDFSVGPVAITEHTLQNTSDQTANHTLEGVFLNFTIANATKDFDPAPNSPTELQELYWYVDDLDQGNYAPINIPYSQHGVVSVGAPYLATASVQPWGATYYEVDVTQCPTNDLIQLKTLDYWDDGWKPMAPVGVGLIAIDDETETVWQIRKKTETYDGYTFTIGQPAVHYERVIAIVAGINLEANTPGSVKLHFSCVAPLLTLPNLPDTLRLPSNPWVVEFQEPIAQIDVKITGGSEIIHGLRPEQFEVYLGGTNDPANKVEVLQVAQIEDFYRLTLRVPEHTAGQYPVTIRVGASEVTNPQGIRYLDNYAYDRLLLIDQTSSMNSKFEAVKAAAKLFIQAASDRGQIGVIGFAAESAQQSDFSLQYLQLQQNMQPDALDGLEPSTGEIAPLADALRLAIERFEADGHPEALRQIVLISDGGEPDAVGGLALWEDARADILEAAIQLHTIALGPSSDQALLQEMALVTGGQYHYVDTQEPETLDNQLADIYAYIAAVMEGRSRIWEETVTMPQGETYQASINLDEELNSAVFSFSWPSNVAIPQIQLLRPDGSLVRAQDPGVIIRQGDTNLVFQLETALVGNWQINVAGADDTRFFAAASGRLFGARDYARRVQLYFGQGHDDAGLAAQPGRLARGVSLPIKLAILAPEELITSGDAIVFVEHPDGTQQRLPLFDDGTSRDAQAGDNIYTAFYRRTTAASPTPFRDGIGDRGSYNVRAELEVTSPDGAKQPVIVKGSFAVVELEDETRAEVDRDRDGLPNRYEAEERCLDGQTDDASGDPDEDSLLSLDEYRAGTSPCRADTDGGGEHDGSEQARGANPFDGADDALQRPRFALVDDRLSEHEEVDEAYQLQPLSNRIRYPVHPNYDLIILERSLTDAGPFQEIARFSAQEYGGFYRDANLQNGQEYFYRLRAVDAAGNESVYSHVFSGVAKADPIPPHGTVSVKGGTTRTDDTSVVLALDVLNEDPANTEVMIADNGRFEGASWRPFEPELTWSIEPSNTIALEDPGYTLSTVFVKFRDQANNESHTYPVTLVVWPQGSLGDINGTVNLEGGADGARIAILVLDEPTIQSAVTDEAGNYSLVNLPPGSYRLLLEYPGYTRQILEVEVSPGATTDVGIITLTPNDRR